MKKLIALVLVMLLLAAPCGAAQQGTTTPLQYGTPEAVYAISAQYEIAEENIAQVTVAFSDAVKNYAYANYVDGLLRVGIASATPIDLSKDLGQVTATLEDGTKIAPTLVLASLKFNGKKATSNLRAGTVTLTEQEGAVVASIPIATDFPCSLTIMTAACDSAGRILDVDILQADATETVQIVSSTLNADKKVSYVKVFYLTSLFAPMSQEKVVPLEN